MMAHAYCTTTDVRASLGDERSTLDEIMLDRVINTSSRAIDDHCDRRFWQDAASAVRVYRVGDCRSARVDDISTTVGLVVKTDTNLDGTWATTWAATDFQLEPLNANLDDALPHAWWRIVAIGGNTFPVHDRRPTLQVTARFGWSAIPDPVHQACVIHAVSLFKRKDAPFGVAGFGDFGAVRIRRDPDVVALLEPFVRMGGNT